LSRKGPQREEGKREHIEEDSSRSVTEMAHEYEINGKIEFERAANKPATL